MGFFDRSRSDRDIDTTEAGSSRGLWDVFFKLVMKKDLDGALAMLEKLVNIEPANPQVFLKMAEILQRKNDIQGAVAAYYKTASTLDGGERGNKAHAIYRIILRLKPDETTARTRLASPPVSTPLSEAEADGNAAASTDEEIADARSPRVDSETGHVHEEQGGGIDTSFGMSEAGGIELASLDGSDTEPEGDSLSDDISHEEQSFDPIAELEGQGQKQGSILSNNSDHEPQVYSGTDALDWGDVPAGGVEPATDMLSGLEQEDASLQGTGVNDSLDWGDIPAEGLSSSSMADKEGDVSADDAQEEDGVFAEIQLSPGVEDSLEEMSGPGIETLSEEEEHDIIGLPSSDSIVGGLDAGDLEVSALQEDSGEKVSPLLQDNHEAVSESDVPDIDPSLWEPPDTDVPVGEGHYAWGGDMEDNVLPPIFSFLSVEDIESLPERAVHRVYPSGSAVIREGDSSDSMFIIKSGSARVETTLKGNMVALGTLSQGDFFGEVAFLTGKPRTASVIAEGELETMEIDRALLQSTIENNPLVLDGLLDIYKSRALDAVRRISKGI